MHGTAFSKVFDLIGSQGGEAQEVNAKANHVVDQAGRLLPLAGILDGAGTCKHQFCFGQTQALDHCPGDETSNIAGGQASYGLVGNFGCHCEVAWEDTTMGFYNKTPWKTVCELGTQIAPGRGI